MFANKLEAFIRGTLDTRIAPMIYVLMGVSVVIGFCFATGFGMAGSESILYNTGVLVHKETWGAILFCTASCAEFGFVTNRKPLILLGGIAGFVTWLFACIALALAAHWYILITVGILHLLFHGYVYLATSLGYIHRGVLDDWR